MGGFAWVTLATNDSYSLGALVLAHSLKQVGTKQQIAVLVTPGVTNAMREKLSSVFNLVQEVNIIDSKDESNLKLLKRPELGVTFSKLHCWRLTQYDKCVFLDADTLILENCDELFEREELSAAPDVGWPDCFNSGVFVYRPSNETYDKLIQFAIEKGSFDGGDQGLLNLYFSDWAHKDISKHLPFIYNMCSTACYSYLPAFKQYGSNVKIIHFIGGAKPWLQYFDTETKTVHPSEGLQHLQIVLQRWWNIFCSLIHPNLSPDMTRSRSDVHINPSFHKSYTNILTDPPSTTTSNPVEVVLNIRDPWEEYDNRQSAKNLPVPINYHHHEYEPIETKPIESHNTNAFSGGDARPHHIPEHFLYNHPPQEYDQVPQPFFQQPLPQPFFQQPLSQPFQQPLPQSVPVFYQANTEVRQELTSPCYNVPSIDFSPSNIPNAQSHIVITELTTPSGNELTVEPLPTNIEITKYSETSLPVLPNEYEVTDNVSKETALHVPTNEEQSDTGIAGALAQLTLGTARTAEQKALDDHLRRQGWEVGNIDYLGRDSFDNIWSKICETLSTALPTSQPKPQPTEPEVTKKEEKTAEATPEATKPKDIENVEPQKEIPPQIPIPESKPVTESLNIEKSETQKIEAKPVEESIDAPICPQIPKETPISAEIKPIESPLSDITKETPAEIPKPTTDTSKTESQLGETLITAESSKSAECSLSQATKESSTKIPKSQIPVAEEPKIDITQLPTEKSDSLATSQCVLPQTDSSIKSEVAAVTECLLPKTQTDVSAEKTETVAAPVCSISSPQKDAAAEAPVCPIPAPQDATTQKVETIVAPVCPIPLLQKDAAAQNLEAVAALVCSIPAPEKDSAAQKIEAVTEPVCPIPAPEKDTATQKTEAVAAPVCPIPAAEKDTTTQKTEAATTPVCPVPAPQKDAIVVAPVCTILATPKDAVTQKSEAAAAPVCAIPTPQKDASAEKIECSLPQTKKNEASISEITPPTPKDSSASKGASTESSKSTKIPVPTEGSQKKNESETPKSNVAAEETKTATAVSQNLAETKVEKAPAEAKTATKPLTDETPKKSKQEKSQQSKQSDAAATSDASPTPPPRKGSGSGGAKKGQKSKK